ncbi:MAG: hypothetical protein ACFE8E_04410, partial [Candidatus Hodarchaeota archaeon]
MSEEELRDEINKIAKKIMEVEEGAKKKEMYVKNKLDEEFDSQIDEMEIRLKNHQDRLEEVNKTLDVLNSERKKLILFVKNLKKQYIGLKKDKEKNLNQKLKLITNEKKAKMKEINQEIQTLEKQ